MNLETDDEVYIEGGDDIGGRITSQLAHPSMGFSSAHPDKMCCYRRTFYKLSYLDKNLE